MTYICGEENVSCDQLLAIELLSSRSLRAVHGTDAEKLILSRTGFSKDNVLFIDDYFVLLHCCHPCHEAAMQIFGFYDFICFSEHEYSQTKWLYQQQNVVLKCGLSLNDSVNKAPISGSSVSTIYKLLARETDRLQEDTYLMICFSSVMLYFVNCYH